MPYHAHNSTVYIAFYVSYHYIHIIWWYITWTPAQMLNERVDTRDKAALLALMSAEADALAAELGLDAGVLGVL